MAASLSKEEFAREGSASLVMHQMNLLPRPGWFPASWLLNFIWPNNSEKRRSFRLPAPRRPVVHACQLQISADRTCLAA
jgi:hypothetical protein